MQILHVYFPLKPGFVNPDIYTWAKVRIMRIENDIWAWVMSSTKCVKVLVRKCEKYIVKNLSSHFKLPEMAENP